MAGYDISAAFSDASTQGLKAGGAFTVGGNAGTEWLPLALVALGARSACGSGSTTDLWDSLAAATN